LRYYIRQLKKHVSGPHALELVRQWVREGKVREDMEFSEDGVTWMLGIEMFELFPVRAPRSKPLRRHRRS
jgi:hypothetical protein